MSVPPCARSSRAELEARIEELIALLDLLDDDPDLEDTGDEEPSAGGKVYYRKGIAEYELEADSSDEEPALGWTEHIDQEKAAVCEASGFETDLEAELGFVGLGTG
ncbi:MAG: hypothetical protein LCH99_29555 [Proteobacteria bacterium]|nr:hypothetical protein [Pseudomonadota bacterium]